MRRTSIALLAGLIALLTACAGPVGGGTATNGADPAAVDPAQRITFAHTLGTDTWDPHANLGGPSLNIIGLVYDTLVHVSPTGEAEPGMATSWEFSDGARTLTMQLREGITFTDGSRFDSSVVKANIERALTHPRSTVRQLLSSVGSVEAPAPMTVVFRLKQPYTALPLNLADRPGMMVSPAALSTDLSASPVGSGPFVLRSYAAGKSASFDRNPDYWDAGTVRTAGLDMTVIVDSKTRLNALLSGAVQMTALDSSQIQEARTSGAVVTTGDDLRFYAFEVNPQVQPALADARVRLALSLAIDRKALVAGLLFGNGTPLDQPFPPSVPASNPAIVGAWDHDVERARSLMAEAGHADGFDLPVAVSTDPFNGQLVEALQAQLAEIGIRVSVQRFDGFGSGNAYWNEKSVPGAVFRVLNSYAPAATLEKFYTARVQANPGDVVDPQVLDMIAKALAETDQDAQIALVHAASARLVEQPLGVIPIMQEQVAVGTSAKVAGTRIWVGGYPNFTGVGLTP